ncbi:hypothetical protein JCM14469_14410 [Desulfatiferula olefinivorans]
MRKTTTPFDPKDIVPIIKRRKSALLIPFFIIMTAGLLLAFLLPSHYRATATILIEEQEIPQEFVMATVNSFAEQRLEMIKQRIMSYGNLLKLIEAHGLYRDLRDRWTTEEIVDKMRDDIHVNTISTEIMDRRTGRATVATIAFTLSYEGKTPGSVHAVTSALTTLFLEENLKVRTRQTEETTRFFEDEINKVKDELFGLNEEISAFKEKNYLSLPEYTTITMQLLDSADKTQEQLVERLKTLREREHYLEAQISLMSPDMEFNSDARRLEELKVLLISLTSKFSDEYPDVINTRDEIRRLTEKLNAGKGRSEDTANRTPDNPTYISYAAQLSGARSEIDSLLRQIGDVQSKKREYESRIGASANIEGRYKSLLAEQANHTRKLDDLTQKLMEAKVAHGLEKDQKGERFTLIDPARMPEKPFKPKRIVIMIIGLIFGLGLGAGTAAAAEFLDDTVRKPQELVRMTGIPVLGEIGVIYSRMDRERIQKRRITLWAGAVLTPLVSVLIFHFFIMDLYVFWAKLARKLAF